MKTVAIIGTFDTKGREFMYVKNLIEEAGLRTLCIHSGVFDPQFDPDVSNTEVAAAVGVELAALAARRDRAEAMDVMSRGIEKLVPRLYAQGRFDGVLSIGGSGGTSLATPAMRALPIGVPKIMVSTVASGNVSQYVGTSDIIMVPSVVDAEGLNEISKRIFTNAANALVGMVKNFKEIPKDGKPLLAATMFGVTTPCIKTAKEYLESHGYEVLVFHATGAGGRSMEALIDEGYIKGVLDITTTEWCDELYGGVLSAGPHRLEAAGRKGIPQVVSVGALDMVNFGPWDTVPAEKQNRNLYKHNPTVTLMRTTVEENAGLGKVIAEKLNAAKGKTALMLPLKGVSMIDAEGQPFYGPAEDEALFAALRAGIAPNVELIEMDNNINDNDFAVAAAQKLLDMLEECS
ncbi:MAG: Tm-1-like ATP-binding domain-containing protein [Oscillospiraceae bacterium]|nr:Tm-1-like ATP-binding domain-containing protein [Oscillospiraceae bacterium]